MPQATFKRVFAAAHRVHNDPGKCNNVHGHNYRVEVRVSAAGLTAQGFVIPFDVVKEVVDRFDHVLILHDADPLCHVFEALPIAVAVMPFVPSTENLAQHLAEQLLNVAVMRGSVGVNVRVELQENDSISALGEAAA